MKERERGWELMRKREREREHREEGREKDVDRMIRRELSYDSDVDCIPTNVYNRISEGKEWGIVKILTKSYVKWDRRREGEESWVSGEMGGREDSELKVY